MDELSQAFQNMNKRETYVQIAAKAGVSRTTVFTVRKNPEQATLRVIRQIVEAMGYRLVIKLERVT